MSTHTPNGYEPEEYPRCAQCGRLAMHAKATLCSLCFLEAPTKAQPSPLADHTANDFTVPKRDH